MKRRILYVQYTNPAVYPPLMHSSRMLADAGWRVKLLGTSGRKIEAIRAEPHERISVDLLPYAPPGPAQKLHYMRFASLVMATAIRFKPDFIYASDLWSCPIARTLRQAGFAVVYHEHDRPATDQRSAFARLCLRARSSLAAAATLCVLPNEERRQDFEREQPRAKTVTVWNCASVREVSEARQPDDAPFTFYYHGSIVPDRLPVTVIEALAQVPDVRLRIGGYETIGATRHTEDLLDAARALNIADRVETLPVAPTRSDLWRQMQSAHAGLTLMPMRSNDSNLERMVGASNKPFDYLARGLALLISSRPDWVETFGQYGADCVPESPTSIAAAMRVLSRDRAATAAQGRAGQQRVQNEWNYEQQFQPVWRALHG